MSRRMRWCAGEPPNEHYLSFPHFPFPEHPVAYLPATQSQQFHCCIMHGYHAIEETYISQY
ncbi:hypothetical protein A3D12_00715 [Candidatus Peribacteria bacterium RIFCSPHIGHO2_02_FULL_55_24]|nr:MAG: hypothetical protein A3D12_00715 [Candidatus Peribacteria bacterium RIFCSPHIGHO2_02_FULL_55_24]